MNSGTTVTCMPKFGLEMRKNEFRMREGSMFLNHGSFGMVPNRVRDAQRRCMDAMEDHPDDWFRRKNLGKWKDARNAVAEFIHADPDDVVFVQNATTGVNTVLKSLQMEDKSGILVTDNTYPAIQNTCMHVKDVTHGSKFHVMNIKYPIESENEVVDQYRDYLSAHPEIKIAVLDHLTSPTALVLPVKDIIQVCRQHDVLAMIDGAHAPGQLPIDLKDLDPDFYTGNLHKWLYTPRGCAILYIKKDHQKWVRPLVTSWYYLKEPMLEFFMQGTRDDCPYLVVPEALKFYEDIGGMHTITGYNSSILDKVTSQMVKEWGTGMLPVPKTMEAPCMRMVRLPYMEGYDATTPEAYRMMDDLFYEHDIQVQLFCFLGSLYIRLSANVYNAIEDYQLLIDLLREVSQNKRPLCQNRKTVKTKGDSASPFSSE